MAKISEQELEDILKDLPAHKIYSELNENFQSEPKFDGYCKRMRKFKKNDNEMKNLCKRIAYNLEKLSGILRNDANDVRCSYFNHWMYNEIWKLVLTEDNYEIDKDAILTLADIGHDINSALSRPYCSYEYYNNRDFSEWMEMKNLHDYFKNFDQIKKKIRSAGDKYESYSKYLKYISKIYVNFEDECCDSELEEFEFKPIYFKCGDDYRPEKLLSLLERNNATSGDQTRVKSLNALSTQEEASGNFTLENDNLGDVSGGTKLNELKKDKFQTTDQSSVITGGGSQNSALPSIQNPVNNSCQNVDRLEDNLGNMNCRSQETSNAPVREHSQQNVEQVPGSLQEATEKIRDERKKGEDTVGSIAVDLTSPTSQVDRHSEQRRNAYVHESGFSSRAVQNGHTSLSYKDRGNGYADSSDTTEEEHNLLEPFGFNFSSILGILKNNLSSISIVSSASIGLIILLLVYFKIRRRKTGMRRKREEVNNSYYTYGEEGIPELLGYSQNFAYSNPDNRQIPIFYSYA
ncbi:PIR protein [Plasmodium vivax]|uniref:VIR protein n=1 Tax=Plasmodium vivax TaxID=5855 RepID=A0A564ZQ80_PLAVI|nr:PIR protein [Plasmodium vivax]